MQTLLKQIQTDNSLDCFTRLRVLVIQLRSTNFRHRCDAILPRLGGLAEEVEEGLTDSLMANRVCICKGH